MNQHEIANSLLRLPHFRTLDGDLLDRVAGVCRVRNYRASETIFRQEENCRGFFAIEKGRVRLFTATPSGREQVVHSLREGQSFAEVALFSLGIYPVNAEAMANPTVLIEIQGVPFLQLFHSEKRIAAAMVGSLCQRLLALVQRVDELSATTAGARLARHILRMPSSGSPITVELSSSKKELANLVSITPETLSRLLRTWREEGVLVSEGRRLILHDVEKLTTIADGD